MTSDTTPGNRATTQVPARSRPDTDRVMRLGSTQIGEDERNAVEEVLRDQVFYRYHGSKVAAFEQRFSALLLDGRPALAVNSGVPRLRWRSPPWTKSRVSRFSCQRLASSPAPPR